MPLNKLPGSEVRRVGLCRRGGGVMVLQVLRAVQVPILRPVGEAVHDKERILFVVGHVAGHSSIPRIIEKIILKLILTLILISMRQGGFTPLIIFGLDFVS